MVELPTATAARLRAAPRRGLSRLEAAQYIGVGVTKFDELVDKGDMPRPKRIGGRIVWDVLALDLAFDALPEDGEEEDTWADVTN